MHAFMRASFRLVVGALLATTIDHDASAYSHDLSLTVCDCALQMSQKHEQIGMSHHLQTYVLSDSTGNFRLRC